MTGQTQGQGRDKLRDTTGHKGTGDTYQTGQTGTYIYRYVPCPDDVPKKQKGLNHEPKTNLFMHRTAGRSGQAGRKRIFSTNDGSQQAAPTGKRYSSGNVEDVSRRFGNPKTWTAVTCPAIPTACRSFPTVTDCPFDGFVKVPFSLHDSTKPLRPLSIHAASIQAQNSGKLPASGMRSPLTSACQAGGTTAPFGRFVAGRGYQNRKATKMITASIQLIDWVPDFEGWPLQKSAPVIWLERVRNFPVQSLTKKRERGIQHSNVLCGSTDHAPFLYC